LSITELEERCGTSEGSKMHFCRDQGSLGFQDFKLALARELASRDKAANLADEALEAMPWARSLLASGAVKSRQDIRTSLGVSFESESHLGAQLLEGRS
jgi:DNA-binding MurR/RpiR family transcriptional regulator